VHCIRPGPARNFVEHRRTTDVARRSETEL
jgi:hypothetical protein